MRVRKHMDGSAISSTGTDPSPGAVVSVGDVAVEIGLGAHLTSKALRRAD
jgi:hypothetical protein